MLCLQANIYEEDSTDVIDRLAALRTCSAFDEQQDVSQQPDADPIPNLAARYVPRAAAGPSYLDRKVQSFKVLPSAAFKVFLVFAAVLKSAPCF